MADVKSKVQDIGAVAEMRLKVLSDMEIQQVQICQKLQYELKSAEDNLLKINGAIRELRSILYPEVPEIVKKPELVKPK